MEERIRELASRGTQVIGVRDTPRFDIEPSRCALEHGAESPECTPTHPMLEQPSPMQDLAEELPEVTAVDMNDLICPDGQCSPVIGNVYTYWDNNHLTSEYVQSLTPMFI